MRSQSTSWAIVRWSVSKPSRGRQAATRSASSCPDAGERPVPHGRSKIRARHDELAPVPSLSGVSLDRPVCRGVADQPGPRVAPGERLPRCRLRVVRLAEDGILSGPVGDLDAKHEAHRVEPRGERGRRARLDAEPRRRPVVDDVQGVLDVTLGAQDERLGRGPRRQRRQVLGRHRVQPGEPVRTGDGDDAPVREVDGGEALDEQALLAQGIAVVGRNTGVRALPRDRARGGEQLGGSHRVGSQSAHQPWIAICVTSARKPRSASTRATKSPAACTGSSSITWQLRQTRWMWLACRARW